jgi:hypothetical protein
MCSLSHKEDYMTRPLELGLVDFLGSNKKQYMDNVLSFGLLEDVNIKTYKQIDSFKFKTMYKSSLIKSFTKNLEETKILIDNLIYKYIQLTKEK